MGIHIVKELQIITLMGHDAYLHINFLFLNISTQNVITIGASSWLLGRGVSTFELLLI